MEAFDHLGLTTDADERAIKRAYAQRLKSVRPDVDPQGFQALHESYRRALGYARWRADNPDAVAADETDETDETSIETPAAPDANVAAVEGVANGPEPAANGSPPQPFQTDAIAAVRIQTPAPFDFEIFFAELVQKGATTDAAGLQAWLKANRALWVLTVKSEAGWRSLQKIGADLPPLTPEQFDALIAFFGFDDVLIGADPIALFNLRASLEQRDHERRARAELEPRNMPALVERLSLSDNGGARAGYKPCMTRLYMALLRRRFAYWWAFPLACLPYAANSVTAFITKLANGHAEFLSPAIELRTITFWALARRGQGSSIRRAIFFVRALAVAVIVTAVNILDEQPRSDDRPAPARRTNSEDFGSRVAWNDPDYKLFQRGRSLQAAAKHQPALEIFDEILERRTTGNETWIGELMTNKVFALAGLRRYDAMVAVVDRMVVRFGDSKDPMMQVYLAQVLYNKGAILLRDPDPERALAIFDEMLVRFEAVTIDDMQEWLARAHFYRATMLHQLRRYEDAVAQYDTYLLRFTGLDSQGTLPRVRRAFLKKAEALAVLGRRSEAIAIYRGLEVRYGGAADDVGGIEVVALAQIGRAGLLDRREDAIAIYDDVIGRLGGHLDPNVKAAVERARKEKAEAQKALAGKN